MTKLFSSTLFALCFLALIPAYAFIYKDIQLELYHSNLSKEDEFFNSLNRLSQRLEMQVARVAYGYADRENRVADWRVEAEEAMQRAFDRLNNPETQNEDTEPVLEESFVLNPELLQRDLDCLAQGLPLLDETQDGCIRQPEFVQAINRDPKLPIRKRNNFATAIEELPFLGIYDGYFQVSDRRFVDLGSFRLEGSNFSGGVFSFDLRYSGQLMNYDRYTKTVEQIKSLEEKGNLTYQQEIAIARFELRERMTRSSFVERVDLGISIIGGRSALPRANSADRIQIEWSIRCPDAPDGSYYFCNLLANEWGFRGGGAKYVDLGGGIARQTRGTEAEIEALLARLFIMESGIDVGQADDISRYLYFSAVNLTTLGYGDIAPITSRARMVVASQSVLGIVFAGLFLNSLAAKATGRSPAPVPSPIKHRAPGGLSALKKPKHRPSRTSGLHRRRHRAPVTNQSEQQDIQRVPTDPPDEARHMSGVLAAQNQGTRHISLAQRLKLIRQAAPRRRPGSLKKRQR